MRINLCLIHNFHEYNFISMIWSSSSSSTRQKQPLLVSEWVTEMAPVAVRAVVAGENHSANLSLVARVSDHGSELRHAMSKLAMLSVRTRTSLLPLVAELRLEHPLVEHLQFQPSNALLLLLLRPTTTPAYPRHIHPLLYPHCTLANPDNYFSRFIISNNIAKSRFVTEK